MNLSMHAQQFQSVSQIVIPSWQSLALTGQQGMVGAASYQNHLPAFGNAYISQSVGFENETPKYNSAWGARLYHESLANGISNNSQLSLTYCYIIRLQNKQYMSLGLRMGVNYFQFNANGAALETEEFIENQNRFSVLSEVGGAWINSNYGIAASLRSPDVLFANKSSYEAQTALLLYGYYYSNKRNDRMPFYTQQLLLEFQKQGFAHYTSSVEYRSIEFSSSINYPFYTKSPWVGVGIGVTVNRYRFKYFYNHPLGEAIALPFSSHQAMLLITFKNKQRVRRY